ncbi:hypothetical protein E2C01_007407 [Portunus trituberculatus]|uniref:U-box domain-containing protein n=1 Tax=Portunus trituberculatus TaxID=210409 RepID=A0A5B7CXU9_PORTR|nr:hypothetical protein [Portunus trituberculatus]
MAEVLGFDYLCEMLIGDLHRRLDIAEPDEGRVALDNVFDQAMNSIAKGRCCPEHYMEALHIAKGAIFKGRDPRCITREMERQLGHLATVLIDTLCNKIKSLQGPVRGPWITAVWKAVLVASYCPAETMSELTLSLSTTTWIKDMFCRRTLCPNPLLRLEMMRFLMSCPGMVLTEEAVGFEVLRTLAQLGPRLTLQDVLPQGRPSISGSLAFFLYHLQRLGLMCVMTSRTFSQVNNQRVGMEARFFAHVTRLMGMKAKALRHLCRSGSLTVSTVMEEYRYLLQTLKVLLVSASCKAVFRLPGLVQVGAIALTNTTISLYRSSFVMVEADRLQFEFLRHTLDSIYGDLMQFNEIFIRELVMQHQQKTLAHAAALGKDVGFPLQHLLVLPTPPSADQLQKCPEAYLDAMTGRIMECPVLLQSSDIVVDMSTLVGFLLFSRDNVPFTLLEDLQQEIDDWRRDNIVRNKDSGGPDLGMVTVTVGQSVKRPIGLAE